MIQMYKAEVLASGFKITPQNVLRIAPGNLVLLEDGRKHNILEPLRKYCRSEQEAKEFLSSCYIRDLNHLTSKFTSTLDLLHKLGKTPEVPYLLPSDSLKQLTQRFDSISDIYSAQSDPMSKVFAAAYDRCSADIKEILETNVIPKGIRHDVSFKHLRTLDPPHLLYTEEQMKQAYDTGYTNGNIDEPLTPEEYINTLIPSDIP